jgi:hypothetical protein
VIKAATAMLRHVGKIDDELLRGFPDLVAVESGGYRGSS